MSCSSLVAKGKLCFSKIDKGERKCFVPSNLL